MDVILSALQSTLNPDPNVRISAELKLSELSTQPRQWFTLSRESIVAIYYF